MNDYEAKKQARIDRYKARAEKADQEKEAAGNRASTLLDAIPPGQPILIGHHSEKKHRAHLKRVDQSMAKYSKEHEKAEHYRGKAHAAENNNAISSDDPEAVVKLKEKLAQMEERREKIKAVNKAYRKAGKPSPEPENGQTWVDFLKPLGYSKHSAHRLRVDTAGDPMNRGPYPSYVLQNLGANIKRVKDRIETLKRQVGRESSEKEFGNITVEQDTEANRVRIYFPGKPAADVRKTLKRFGFRWAPSVGAWQRQLNNNAAYWAEDLARQFSEGANDE